MVDHPVHPHHETALMLLRAAGFYDHQAKAALASGTAGLTIIRGDILAMAAAVDAEREARGKALREAAQALIADCMRCGLGVLADQIDPLLVAALEAAMEAKP